MDKDTWSRSMVAMLGLGMIGDLPQGWLKQRRWCHPSTRLVQATRAQLKRDDRSPIIRHSRQGSGVRASPEGPERAQRVNDCAKRS